MLRRRRADPGRPAARHPHARRRRRQAHLPIYRCRPRTIPRSACAASARACGAPDLLDVQLRALLARRRATGASCCPMITDVAEMRAVRAHAARARRGARDAGTAARRHDRNAGRGAARRRRSRAKSTSSRSARTTSRSTRWRWIAATPSSPRASMRPASGGAAAHRRGLRSGGACTANRSRCAAGSPPIRRRCRC